MDVRRLAIEDVALLTPKIFRDDRGFFSETFNTKTFSDAGFALDFVQDNHSLSVETGVLRGLHFQIPPRAQDKLVRVIKGSIFDVAVDIRADSPTFGQHVSAVLSADNWTQILVPKGFAHGFCTLEPNTEVIYKVTDYFAPECDRGIRWDDPALGIAWPLKGGKAVLSPKDLKNPLLSELPRYFGA